MKIETLKDRIEKAKEMINKKENTIIKKTKMIEKKQNQIEKAKEDNEKYWFEADIRSLEDDIKRGKKEIEAKKETLTKYELQLKGELEKESLYVKEMPSQFKQLQEALVERWNEWNKNRKATLIEKYKELGYKEFIKEYSYNDYDFMRIDDKKLEATNEKEAKALIIDLYNRVKEITGEVESWEDVHATQGAQGMVVLNGTVKGKEGVAQVESILAGGYNIQRLHIRVLVKAL
jgi:chromosome segregation ATPase